MIVLALVGWQVPPATPKDSALPAAVACYAKNAADACARSAAAAHDLRDAVRRFCDAPTEDLLAECRRHWTSARAAYCETEALRFCDGPIDRKRGGVETFVNAWPVDEGYIEPGAGTGKGLVGDRARYPTLAKAVIRMLNQRGGETNVCTGWHAIEFMLWGHDDSELGPGHRAATDFEDGKAPDADRRREFLAEIADMLCDDLDSVAAQWRLPEGAHRARIEGDPALALRSMLVGPALLSAFELGGERLAVAVETHDQHEETSCFSDTSHLDFRNNLRGIRRVLDGDGCTGVIEVIRARDPEQAKAIAEALAAAVRAAEALPTPLDHAIRAPDASPEHAALMTALQAFERLGAAITAGARVVDVILPTEPLR